MKKYIALAFVFFATQQTQGMEDIIREVEDIAQRIEGMYLMPVGGMEVEDQGENSFYNQKKRS